MPQEMAIYPDLTVHRAFDAVARGAESWQDDVVFYFPTNLSVFWYQSRVWQVRFDRRYASTGISRSRIASGMISSATWRNAARLASF